MDGKVWKIVREVDGAFVSLSVSVSTGLRLEYAVGMEIVPLLPGSLLFGFATEEAVGKFIEHWPRGSPLAVFVGQAREVQEIIWMAENMNGLEIREFWKGRVVKKCGTPEGTIGFTWFKADKMYRPVCEMEWGWYLQEVRLRIKETLEGTDEEV